MCGKIQILILHGAKANKILGFLNPLTVPLVLFSVDAKYWIQQKF